MNDAGLRIKNRRESLGLSQTELANRVGYKSKVSISKIETCRDIPVKKLKPIADALEITVAELMGWEEEAEPTEALGEFLASLTFDKVLVDYIKKIQAMSDEDKEALYKYIDFLSAK